jgi:hypothetical protein
VAYEFSHRRDMQPRTLSQFLIYLGSLSVSTRMVIREQVLQSSNSSNMPSVVAIAGGSGGLGRTLVEVLRADSRYEPVILARNVCFERVAQSYD